MRLSAVRNKFNQLCKDEVEKYIKQKNNGLGRF